MCKKTGHPCVRFPALARVFMFDFLLFFLFLCFYFFRKKHTLYLSRNFVIPFAMLFNLGYLAYLTYCASLTDYKNIRIQTYIYIASVTISAIILFKKKCIHVVYTQVVNT